MKAFSKVSFGFRRGKNWQQEDFAIGITIWERFCWVEVYRLQFLVVLIRIGERESFFLDRICIQDL